MLVGTLGSGVSSLGALQLGGPPAYPSATWLRALPTSALPYLAHLYASDGITFQASFPVLTRPPIKNRLTNGSFDKLLLDVAIPPSSSLYGQALYGGALYGGASAIAVGMVIYLTEQDGDGTIVYAGIVNSMPDSISPTVTTHQLELTPFGYEFDDTTVQLNYTVPTDLMQMVRDAAAATAHCHCDQTSVPLTCGVLELLDFRNQKAVDVLNTVRHILGYQWFWHVGAGGRTWFQPTGSVGTYTAKLGADYSKRQSNGGEITYLRNDVLVVGGPSVAGPLAQQRYTGASQRALGRRALTLFYPAIIRNSTLLAIATGVGAVLDRVWNRVSLTLVPGFGTRIHAEQPGGAMFRYQEPTVLPFPESEAGSGLPTAPFVVSEVTVTGAEQAVIAADVAVTDLHDLDYMIAAAVRRAAAAALTNSSAPLETPH